MAKAEIHAGQVLGGRYTLLTLIARGGMGEVWKARDSFTGTLVAAKVLRSELIGEEVSLSRLRLEAKNAMRAKHPNIAAVLDSGEEDAQGWLIMEMVDGEPLTSFMGDGLTLSPEQLLPLLTQTAYALDAAARANVVHRDIKPANIMVKNDGRVKLTDFGVSLAAGQANLTAAGMVMGTAQYLPPEQALGETATPLGDLYALGVIAYEALAGERPYSGASQVDIAFAHVNEPVPSLPETVPQPLADLITRLLSKDPEGRPATGAALARELNQVAEELGITTEPTPLPAVVVESKAPPSHKPKPQEAMRQRPSAKEFTSTPVATDSTSPVPAQQHATPARRAGVADQLDRDNRWLPIGDGSGPAAPIGDHSPASPSGTMRDNTGEEEDSSRWGLWVIVALTVLTVVLIIFAILRNNGVIGAEPSAIILQIQQIQEVEPWLVTSPAV